MRNEQLKFEVIFYLVLELRIYLKFHLMFLIMSESVLSFWMFKRAHYVTVRSTSAMGSHGDCTATEATTKSNVK